MQAAYTFLKSEVKEIAWELAWIWSGHTNAEEKLPLHLPFHIPSQMPETTGNRYGFLLVGLDRALTLLDGANLS